jgi:6-phosphogluconolactonase/glucosamine-6-phosphate isomerase/deaminase
MDFRVADQPAIVAAASIARRLAGALRQRSVASVALSGGSTAPAMIDALIGHDLPWAAITVWQVDERIASDGDPARNANQLVALPCQVRLMPVTADDLAAAADDYAASLPERFDVVHLGIGDDGHTASWPPGDLDVVSSPRAVEVTSAAFNGRRRMTLTPTVVNAARSRLVLATGAGKRPVIERWLLGDASLPISLVRRASTTVVLDHAAAPAVPLHDG